MAHRLQAAAALVRERRNVLFTALAVGAALVFVGGTATAGILISSGNIKNQSIQSVDIAPDAVGSSELRAGSVGFGELSEALKEKVAVKLEADGPYPGATDLGDLEGQGDNSDAKVKGDEGASVQEVWVQCAEGKSALGGGFHVAADDTLAAKKAIQVVASEPTQIDAGKVVYEPIAGDEAGSFKPNGWRLDVVNNGTTDVIVRPWVTCGKVG